VDITQEFVADMLGVQRASVSLVASSLQNQGLISYRRGHIEIQNEAGLIECACECYRALERQYDLLFRDTRPAAAIARPSGPRTLAGR
jgi:Mn-dependent DtxR family transcriptional regulator